MVEVRGVAQTQAGLRSQRGESEVSRKQSGGGENVVELAECGSGVNGVLHAAKALLRRTEMNLAGAEFRLAQGRGFSESDDLCVTCVRLDVMARVKVGVAEGLVVEGVAHAQLCALIEAL